MRKKRISNLDDFPFPETSDKTDKRKLQNFENTDINFKRRKIRVGDNYNMDMDHYFKNEDDIDETDICSGLRVVFTCRNKLTEREIDIYLREAKLLWDYRDISIEGELWFDFYEYFEEFIKYKELDVEQQQKVANKLNNLRSFVDRGINMENHFEEMALKILHICAYSTKKALFFIFKGINPFMEEEIEGFKSDVMQLQREVFCVFTDQDQDSNKYG